VSLGVLIFLITYFLISARRLDWLGLDRPSGALLGAVLTVGLGVLSPNDALAAVDARTLLLLFGVMALGAFLAVDGFFGAAEQRLVSLAKTRSRLLGCLVWGSGALAPLITNDAVCVLGTPMVVELVRRQKLPPLPFLLALATAANTGSVATLVGNPQNMLAANLGGLSYREHLVLMAPVAVLGLAINHAVLALSFRRELSGALSPTDAPAAPLLTRRVTTTLLTIALTAVACVLGADLAWTVTGGAVLLLLLHRRDTAPVWANIDWSILLFFAGLFVVVHAFERSGVPRELFARYPLWTTDGPLGWARLSAIFLVGSNVVSNVPFILVVREAMSSLPNQKLGWELLAMASTFAGNLTFLGSVANVIVAEKSRSVGAFGFWQYLRVGAPTALLSTAVGTAWLVWVAS
jgi:Na+/H+ antiporter NhaD/arsenite permease-like protein